MHRLTRAALNVILMSTGKELSQFRTEYEQELRVLVDTLYDGAVALYKSTRINEMETNVSQLVSTFVDEADDGRPRGLIQKFS